MEPVCAATEKQPPSSSAVLLTEEVRIKSRGPVIRLTKEFFIAFSLCISLLLICLSIAFFPHIIAFLTLIINTIGVHLGYCRSANFC